MLKMYLGDVRMGDDLIRTDGALLHVESVRRLASNDVRVTGKCRGVYVEFVGHPLDKVGRPQPRNASDAAKYAGR